MKIIDNRKAPKQMRFEDIDKGNAFLDCSGDVCIKVSPTQLYSFEHNILLHVNDCSVPYTVVNAELTISDWS